MAKVNSNDVKEIGSFLVYMNLIYLRITSFIMTNCLTLVVIFWLIYGDFWPFLKEY